MVTIQVSESIIVLSFIVLDRVLLGKSQQMWGISQITSSSLHSLGLLNRKELFSPNQPIFHVSVSLISSG